MLIGAGGAARAFCEAMNRMGCIDVAVAVRDVERSRRFVVEMEKAFPRMNLTLASMEDLHHLNHDLVFNASPMGAGGEPLPKELKRVLPGSKVVFDAVYRPRETKLLAGGEAQRVGGHPRRGDAPAPGDGGLQAVDREGSPGEGDEEGAWRGRSKRAMKAKGTAKR